MKTMVFLKVHIRGYLSVDWWFIHGSSICSAISPEIFELYEHSWVTDEIVDNVAGECLASVQIKVMNKWRIV